MIRLWPQEKKKSSTNPPVKDKLIKNEICSKSDDDHFNNKVQNRELFFAYLTRLLLMFHLPITLRLNLIKVFH